MNSTNDVVIISDKAFKSNEPYDAIDSNISFVNALISGQIRQSEISRQALTSYYVDYYLAQVNNGGFSQFVFNSGWRPDVNAMIQEGLKAMNAPGHLALFEEGAASIDRLGHDRMRAFFESGYFGENAERDALNTIDDRFYALAASEDLIKLNSAWLKARPDLRVLSTQEMQKEADKRIAAIPDRDKRIEAAKENEPRYFKLIRALCEKSGHEFVQVNAGDWRKHYDGETLRQLSDDELDGKTPSELQMTWTFRTDKGLFVMAEANGKAAMFDYETRSRIADIDASPFGDPE